MTIPTDAGAGNNMVPDWPISRLALFDGRHLLSHHGVDGHPPNDDNNGENKNKKQIYKKNKTKYINKG